MPSQDAKERFVPTTPDGGRPDWLVEEVVETVEGDPPRSDVERRVRVPQTDTHVLAGRHPSANTVEALRAAIDNSVRILDTVSGDLAALVAEGLRPPASLSRHRSFHLMRLRIYIDRYYAALNCGIETATGLAMDDIGPGDLP